MSLLEVDGLSVDIPLAGGVLCGKYQDGARPEGCRFTFYLEEGDQRQKAMAERFVNERSLATTAALADVAEQEGITVPQLALAWSKQHDFVASTLFGVNNLDHLEENLKAADIVLSDDAMKAIDAISQKYPYPMG